LVERGPEKAGVGGSIPSLATNNFNNLAIAKKDSKILARTIRVHRLPKLASEVGFTLPLGVVDSGNLFSRQPDIALHQLDTRVAQALCELGRVSIIRLDFVTYKTFLCNAL
jgi:hypothetical protein